MIRHLTLLICAVLLVGCSEQTSLEFRPATYDAPESGAVSQTPPQSDRPIYLLSQAIVTEQDVASASVTVDEMGRPAIAVVLKDAAGDRLFEYTKQHLGQPVAIVLDGDLVSAPVIQAPVRMQAVITGDFTDAEAQRIADNIGGH